MKFSALLLSVMFFILISSSCGSGSGSGNNKKIILKIDNSELSVQWEGNESVDALKKILENGYKIIDMHRYGDFEQVGSLGQTLTSDNRQMTTSPGDIVLYNGNQIVIFYGSNSWSYTKLGKITGKTDSELKTILDKANVTLRLSIN